MDLIIPKGKVKFLEEMILGSDRICAILGGTFADVALRKAISKTIKNKSHIDDLFSSKTELSGFKAKTELAFALGLIGNRPRADLNLIGEIRNKFAHNLDFNSFDVQSIRDKCDALWIPKNLDQINLSQSTKETLKRPMEGKSIHRLNYEITVSVIVGGLYMFAFDSEDSTSPLIWD